jgi:ABC-type spermidine/putrescine transport system permease subunit II
MSRAWLVAILIFLFAPIAVIVAYSFNGGPSLYMWTGFSPRWYGVAFDNRQMVSALLVSLKVALVTTVVSLGIGVPAGISLARRPGKWQVPFLALLSIVLLTPELVAATGLLVWLDMLRLSDGTLRLVIAHSLFNLTIVVLMVRARLEQTSGSLERAAADLGATPWQAFWDVTVPTILPAVLAAALLSFSFSFDNVVLSMFLQRPGSSTLPLQILSSVRIGLTGQVAAIVTLMLAVNLFALAAAAWFLLRGGSASGKEARPQYAHAIHALRGRDE